MTILLILVTLGCGGGGHAAVLGSKLYPEYLVPTLTVLTPVYAEVPAFVLLGVVAGVLSAAAYEAVLG